MPNFKFTIKEKLGNIRRGNVQANSKEEALLLLKKEGGYVLLLEEIQKKTFDAALFSKKIPQKDIILFSKQLSVMLQSKITLIESLKIIVLELQNQEFKSIIVDIIEKIRAGQSFSENLKRYPKAFPPLYVNIVMVGETSGTLSDSLLYLIENLEEQQNIKSKVKSAMVYPILVITVMVAIVGFIFLYIFPVFLMPTLLETGAELPIITVIVINFVNFLTTNILQIILIILFLIGGLIILNNTKRGRYFLHKNYLKIPIVGDLMKKFYMSQFAMVFHTSIKSGLSTVRSLDMIEKVINNMVYKETILTMSKKVNEGELLSTVTKKYSSLFSFLFVQMLIVGEKTGLSESALKNVCSIYNEEIDRKIKIAISLLEPLIIVIIGIVVLIVVVAVFLPIMQMTMIEH